MCLFFSFFFLGALISDLKGSHLVWPWPSVIRKKKKGGRFLVAASNQSTSPYYSSMLLLENGGNWLLKVIRPVFNRTMFFFYHVVRFYRHNCHGDLAGWVPSKLHGAKPATLIGRIWICFQGSLEPFCTLNPKQS